MRKASVYFRGRALLEHSPFIGATLMKKMTLAPVRKLTGVVLRAFGPMAAEYHELQLSENDAAYDEYCYGVNSIESHTMWLYSQIGMNGQYIDRIFFGMVREAASIAGVTVREALDYLDRVEWIDRDLLIETLWVYMYVHYMELNTSYLGYHGLKAVLAAHLLSERTRDLSYVCDYEYVPFDDYYYEDLA